MSTPAPAPAPAPSITPVMLDTVLNHLAPHFLAAASNHLPAARRAAFHMLQAYNAVTEEELNLAGEIVTFRFQALEALSEAAAADLSINRKLRLRGSAVSLSRQSHKAQRKLDQLQRARHTASQAVKTPDPAPDRPQDPDSPPPPLDVTSPLIDAGGTQDDLPIWALSRQQRRAAERIADTLRRNQQDHQRRQAAQAGAHAPSPAAPQPAASHAAVL